MTDLHDLWLAIVGFVLGTGGTALINWFTHRQVDRATINSSTVKDALDLEEIAMKRYTSIESKLKAAEELLYEVREENGYMRGYIAALQAILKKHSIDYPGYHQYRKKEEK
jgi:hypothetical protein